MVLVFGKDASLCEFIYMYRKIFQVPWEKEGKNLVCRQSCASFGSVYSIRNFTMHIKKFLHLLQSSPNKLHLLRHLCRYYFFLSDIFKIYCIINICIYSYKIYLFYYTFYTCSKLYIILYKKIFNFLYIYIQLSIVNMNLFRFSC